MHNFQQHVVNVEVWQTVHHKERLPVHKLRAGNLAGGRCMQRTGSCRPISEMLSINNCTFLESATNDP